MMKHLIWLCFIFLTGCLGPPSYQKAPLDTSNPFKMSAPQSFDAIDYDLQEKERDRQSKRRRR